MPLALLRARRARTTAIAAAVVLSVALVAPATAAQSRTGFAVNRFEPAERGSQHFVVDSLDLRAASAAAGATFDYAYKPLVVYDTTGAERSALVRHQALIHLGGSVVLAGRLRLALDAPVALYQDGEGAVVDGVTLSPSTAPAFGDLRLAADVRVAGNHGEPLSLAVGVRGWLPTGVALAVHERWIGADRSAGARIGRDRRARLGGARSRSCIARATTRTRGERSVASSSRRRAWGYVRGTGGSSSGPRSSRRARSAAARSSSGRARRRPSGSSARTTTFFRTCARARASVEGSDTGTVRPSCAASHRSSGSRARRLGESPTGDEPEPRTPWEGGDERRQRRRDEGATARGRDRERDPHRGRAPLRDRQRGAPRRQRTPYSAP